MFSDVAQLTIHDIILPMYEIHMFLIKTIISNNNVAFYYNLTIFEYWFKSSITLWEKDDFYWLAGYFYLMTNRLGMLCVLGCRTIFTISFILLCSNALDWVIVLSCPLDQDNLFTQPLTKNLLSLLTSNEAPSLPF